MVLDTKAYTGLANAQTELVEVIKKASDLIIPLPVIAELRYGFLKGAQTSKNEQNLEKFLAQPQINVVSPTFKTTAVYAELQLYCTQKGKALSNNDIWIAALTQENNETLVTYDQDFSIFSELWNDKLIILTATGK